MFVGRGIAQAAMARMTCGGPCDADKKLLEHIVQCCWAGRPSDAAAHHSSTYSVAGSPLCRGSYRLGATERELLAAVAGMDESPDARTRYARAFVAYHAAAALAEHVIRNQEQTSHRAEQPARGVHHRLAHSQRPRCLSPLESNAESRRHASATPLRAS